jgi:hypothetical protein
VGWRWTFGAAALALAAATCAGFLDGVAVTDRDLVALGSGNQDLMSAALAHMFEGGGGRLLHAFVLLLPALAVLWTIAASLGRTVTLRMLMPESGGLRWFPIFVLHFTRAALGVATLLAAFGTLLFAVSVSTRPDPDGVVRPDLTLYLLILLFALPVLAMFWSFLNWLLSLAPIFVMRERASTLASIAWAARAARERKAALAGTTALFGLLRLLALGGLLLLSAMVAGAFSAAGLQATAIVLGLLALAYFVVADMLFIARLAAYVEICRPADALVPDSTGPLPVPIVPLQTPASADSI